VDVKQERAFGQQKSTEVSKNQQMSTNLNSGQHLSSEVITLKQQ
jgi:hypothetical protein